MAAVDGDGRAGERDAERTLSRSVVRGDRAALERLHDDHFDPLYRFVYPRVGGIAAEAEEVVQATFLSALEGLHRFRGEASLFTWLCGIAKNHIARERRRQGRMRLADTLERLEPDIYRILSRLDEELPEKILEREETQDLVGATMASLPPDYQQVLVDKYVNALPVAEIARRRDQSAKAVESALSRSRVAFKRIFTLLARALDQGTARA